jgi:hypothetical protein
MLYYWKKEINMYWLQIMSVSKKHKATNLKIIKLIIYFYYYTLLNLSTIPMKTMNVMKA